MIRNRKTLAAATTFAAATLLLSGCEGSEVHVSNDTAKNLACSTARASNKAGAVSDDMRKDIARSIADSVSDETIKSIARRIEQSETPEKLRAAYAELIDKACGPEAPAQ